MQYISEIAKEIFIIVSCLVLIGGLIYWVLKSKLKEEVLNEYCLKEICDKKHTAIDGYLLNYRKETSIELKEIKDTINEVRKMLFDFISKK